MDNELICNFKKCRKHLTSLAWVTSCSHIFCNEDGTREFEKAFICPACDSQLPGKFDVVRVDLNPSEQYKSMVLAGQKPDIILEICSKAIAFWTYQIHQEIMFQEYISSKAKDKYKQLEKYYENILERSRIELNSIKQQLEKVKLELETSKKKATELSEKLTEKSRQYQKLQLMYEGLRRKFISPFFMEKEVKQKNVPIRNDTPFGISAANDILQCAQKAEKDFVLHPARTPIADFLNEKKTPIQSRLIEFGVQTSVNRNLFYRQSMKNNN
ncbi:E3 ubiquitin-protein ligase CCNB1IP1-like isoform X1 [Centruroides sculpturatus]|uniref:E3 ubiquitin-protein ligase CCNB1IP1-like isoform X1 n=1 Tax=Centruroides sculpturatus TaxID=218467 RepID=UPI000C6DAB76|nr:E3 ubiquitin-protein ligase CCNB1IP1-like isoform X1 [Centruroides sculpturatus]